MSRRQAAPAPPVVDEPTQSARLKLLGSPEITVSATGTQAQRDHTFARLHAFYQPILEYLIPEPNKDLAGEYDVPISG